MVHYCLCCARAKGSGYCKHGPPAKSDSHSTNTCCGDNASSLRFMERRRAFLAAKIACLDGVEADMVNEDCWRNVSVDADDWVARTHRLVTTDVDGLSAVQMTFAHATRTMLVGKLPTSSSSSFKSNPALAYI